MENVEGCSKRRTCCVMQQYKQSSSKQPCLPFHPPPRPPPHHACRYGCSGPEVRREYHTAGKRLQLDAHQMHFRAMAAPGGGQGEREAVVGASPLVSFCACLCVCVCVCVLCRRMPVGRQL